MLKQSATSITGENDWVAKVWFCPNLFSIHSHLHGDTLMRQSFASHEDIDLGTKGIAAHMNRLAEHVVLGRAIALFKADVCKCIAWKGKAYQCHHFPHFHKQAI